MKRRKIGETWIGKDYAHGPRLKDPKQFDEFRLKTVKPGVKIVLGRKKGTKKWVQQSTIRKVRRVLKRRRDGKKQHYWVRVNRGSAIGRKERDEKEKKKRKDEVYIEWPPGMDDDYNKNLGSYLNRGMAFNPEASTGYSGFDYPEILKKEGEIKFIEPKDFIRFAKRKGQTDKEFIKEMRERAIGDEEVDSPKKFDELVKAIKSDKKLVPPVIIEFSVDKEKPTFYEGRHRIAAAEVAGVKKVPAKVVKPYGQKISSKLKKTR